MDNTPINNPSNLTTASSGNSLYRVDFEQASKDFKNRACKIRWQKWLVFVFLILIVFSVIGFSWVYENCIFRIELLEKWQELTDKKISNSWLSVIYLLGKTVGLLFLISLFVWVAKIFNNLRRLEITYHDKSLNLGLLMLLTYDADYKDQIVGILNSTFEPTLHQAESNDKHENHYEKLIEPLAKLIDKVADKLSTR
jgi:hypothetical protein